MCHRVGLVRLSVMCHYVSVCVLKQEEVLAVEIVKVMACTHSYSTKFISSA